MTADPERNRLYKTAYSLAVITILYNIVEGVVSVYFGVRDDTIALFGFGLDSFVEVISGLGIWHMIRRQMSDGQGDPGPFEKRALRITGSAFYLLFIGLLATAAVNLYTGHRPDTTLWGIVIALISVMTMWILVRQKLRVGSALQSEAIVSDAHCTRACMYLSLVLLAASIGYEATGIGGLDSLGALGIAVFSLREGREAFEKARGAMVCSCAKCE